MFKRREMSAAKVILILIFAVVFMSCSGGGGSSEGASNNPPATSPSQQVLPASYDFGTVTVGNAPAPLEVKIKNNGTANLRVSGIVLSDLTNFTLNLGGGSSPCNSANPTIAAGGTCTFEVGFEPTADGPFVATVQIRSNDAANPTFSLSLSGISEPVKTLTVRINQVETGVCPATTAYVSVTDQGGYPLTGLDEVDFTSVDKDGTSQLPLTSFNFVSQVFAPVSIAAVMDYSNSLTETPDVVSDMEQGLVTFVDDLRANDQMEIIKFATEFEVVQPFISDKPTLTSAILAAPNVSGATRLYDSVWQAIEDTKQTATARMAVIVITDGVDTDGAGNQLSSHSLENVIDNAVTEGIPIFTIGIGSGVDTAVLTRMADDTGGQYFESASSDNLRTIYQQLSSILFENQYVLQFNQTAFGAGASVNLTIGVTSQGINGNDTRQITSCN